MALVGGSVELTASLARSVETNATVSHFTNIWKSGQAAANRLLTATDGEGARDRSTASSVVWAAAAADIGDRVQLSMVSMESSLSRPR